MTSRIAALLLATASGLAGAADLTPQEQQIVTGIRQMYAKQMGRQPTADEEQKLLERWRAVSLRSAVSASQIARLAQGGMPADGAAATAAGPAMTEAALAETLAAQGPAKSRVTMEHVRDGLKIGGASYLDPEGPIKSFAYDVLSGDLSYAISVGESLVYKYLRAGSGADPVTFATARPAGSGWQVSTVTGKNLAGNTVTPLARGVMVARAGSVFLYEPGKGNLSAAVPEGWVMAPFQRGNVGATKFVMLERAAPSSEARGTVGGLFSSLKSLGAVVGVNKKEDYALMHLDTGKLHLLNVQSSGKNQTVMSNCSKRNALVNNCTTMNSFESLYTDIGRNFGHYFWKADWYATPSGPIAVTMENGVADVYVLDLTSGKKVSVFHRALGITSLDTVQGPDGTVAIKAKWMAEDHKVDDAAKFLQENAALADAASAAKP